MYKVCATVIFKKDQSKVQRVKDTTMWLYMAQTNAVCMLRVLPHNTLGLETSSDT
jgi:hypothetical protein